MDGDMTEKIIEFSVDDVRNLAESILAFYPAFEDGDYSSFYGYYCEYCGGESDNYAKEYIIHKSDCAVLVAKDVLTRLDE